MHTPDFEMRFMLEKLLRSDRVQLSIGQSLHRRWMDKFSPTLKVSKFLCLVSGLTHSLHWQLSLGMYKRITSSD